MGSDVSVVVPTFRRPNELREAIASVLVQPGVSVDVKGISPLPQMTPVGSLNGMTYLAQYALTKNPLEMSLHANEYMRSGQVRHQVEHLTADGDLRRLVQSSTRSTADY